LEGSQSSPVRPSDKGNVKAKVLGWLEIVAWNVYKQYIKVQSVPLRKHITSPLQNPTC
jgi:hypothetical protein